MAARRRQARRARAQATALKVGQDQTAERLVKAAADIAKVSQGLAQRMSAKPSGHKIKHSAAAHPVHKAKAHVSMEPGGLHAGMNAHKNLAEEAYLASFIDPQHPARGPGSSNYPTVLGTFKASTAVNLTSSVAAEATGFRPPATQFPWGNGASILIVTPHIPALTLSGGTALAAGDVPQLTNVGICSGFIVEPHIAMQDVVYNSSSYARPLSNFQSNLPDLVNNLMNPVVTGGDDWIANAGSCISFRTVGLRATITVTDPLTAATGMVFAGDNGDYFMEGAEPRFEFDTIAGAAPTAYQVGPGTGSTNTTAAPNATLAERNLRPRVTQAGAFMKGEIYEASWLPTSDRAITYADRVPIVPGETAAGWSGAANDQVPQWMQTTLGELLVNQGACMFDLSGLRDGATFNVDVTWSVEMQVEPTSSIGFLLSEARFAPRFVPDWMEYACCCPGGLLGSTMHHYSNCQRKAAGFLVNASGMQLGHPPSATGNGAVPTNHPHSVAHKVASVVGEAAGAAALAYANRGIIARGLSRLKGVLGTAGRAAAGFGRAALPELEEAAMIAL